MAAQEASIFSEAQSRKLDLNPCGTAGVLSSLGSLLRVESPVVLPVVDRKRYLAVICRGSATPIKG